MTSNLAFGHRVRLRRLYRHGGDRLLIVPMDHPVTDGPIVPGGALGPLVARFAAAEVDAVVLHKGALRHVEAGSFAGTALILHLSASTAHAPDPDAKYLVATVEEALRLGADAVSVHVNLGSTDERRQVADLALVADACDRWRMPLLAMVYPRGPRVTNPRDPALVAHAATLAADLGADLVKTPYVGTVAEMADVVRSCPIPLLVAGGARLDGTAALLSYVDDALRAGVSGLAMGRNLFQAADAGGLARLVAGRVHATGAGAPPERELVRAAS
jgi:2-amino-4,5-dihydroxy-6-oxo-7-(phosphonooxy)heptanoate synthase